MTADPSHEIAVLFALAASYAALGAAVWLIFCGGAASAVRRLNAAVADRNKAAFAPGGIERGAAGISACGAPPDLDATLAALVAERRLPPKAAARLRRIGPVFHRGKWVVYPSNAYWAHRFERFDARR